MKTAIVTDSNCGISKKEADTLDLHIIPMPVLIHDTTYYENQDLNHETFFKHLMSNEQVSTSQPAPADLIFAWESILNQGYDNLVYVPMSSGLSSSYQTAVALAEDYPEQVYVADARRISVTQRHAVLDAVSMCRQKMTAADIVTTLEQHALHSIALLGVDDLSYLKRGGRITPAASAMASILNIKPLLIIQGEKIDSFSKVRGQKNCQKKLLKAMKEKAELFKSKGYAIHVGITSSYLENSDIEKWYQKAKETFPNDTVVYDPLTFSVACHTGPNSFGMGISVKVDSLYV